MLRLRTGLLYPAQHMAVEISLDPANPPGQEPETPLGQQIQRITQERGSFAKLNEQELHDKSESQVSGTPKSIEEDNSAGDELAKLRAELVNKVGTALNESALNLDFVSLLVSASRPQAGESSMSPMLRSQIPSQSFNADTVARPAPTVPSHCGYGWKINAFNTSASHLGNSATVLTERIRREGKFWRNMLYISTENGEVANRKLQVKYGFRDSGSQFHGGGYGVGTLRKTGLDGHAKFSPSIPVSPALVQVSLFADANVIEPVNTTAAATPASSEAQDMESPPPERLVGRSTIPFEAALSDLEEPLKSIRFERNWLFEHELMQQIIQEARSELASHGVRLLDEGKVVCGLFGARIEIELVKPGELAVEDINNPATAINYGFHLLLTHWFKQNFDARHTVPPPLSKTSAPTSSSPQVLAPVLAHVQHSILVSRALRLVQIMLPDAEVTTHPNSEQTSENPLLSTPQCTVVIICNKTKLQLEIRSPITTGDKPPIIGQIEGLRTTKVYDLTELELWLKWVTSKQFDGNVNTQS